MPQTPNLDNAIRNLVAQEVAAVLEPYRAMLDRVVAMIDHAPAKRGPGRPRKNGAVAAEVAAAPARRGRKPANNKARLSKFSQGQTVQYKQGRGTFDAEVVEIDAAKGALTLKRLSDGKQVVRPASKVTVGKGAAEAPVAKAAKAPKAKAGRKAGKKAAKSAAPVGDISKFSDGMIVLYKQGRGTFDAKVIGIDAAAGTLKLERVSDGKVVARPVAKVGMK